MVSASALTSLTLCPAQWFLNREAGAERATTQAQGFGNVVHALADRIGRGDEPVSGRLREDVVDALMTHVDQVWGQIPFRTPWSSGREREEVRHALDRFLVKHEAAGRELVATEVPLRAEVDLPDGQSVLLHGYADRLELDAQGRVVVVDLKTGKGTPTQAEIAEHPQLGLYQLAVENGAIEDTATGRGEPSCGSCAGARRRPAGAAAGSAGARRRRRPSDRPAAEEAARRVARRGVPRPAGLPLRPTARSSDSAQLGTAGTVLS